MEKIVIITCLIALFSNICAFEDPISIIGRLKWNYSMFEESRWSRELNSTAYAEIFWEHQTFIQKINHFSDIIVFSSGNFSSNNSDYMAAFDSVSASKKTISDYWKHFSGLSTINVNDSSLNSFIDEAIKALNFSMNNVWNETAISIQFEYLMNKSLSCREMDHSGLNIQSLMERFFFDTILNQIKAYIMLQLSIFTKATKDFPHFHLIARALRIYFNYRYIIFTKNSENLMWNLSRTVWSCDKFQSPESSTQLTNFIQGYIDNEINMNPDGSCDKYCHDYKLTWNFGCNKKTICATNYFDHNKTRCNGFIRNCHYFGASFDYCPNENDNEIDRRIDFVKLKSGRTLGNEHFCPDFSSAQSLSFLFSTCRYCFCYCDERGPRSHRYFSLHDVTSDILKNRVLSGIRLTKLNGIIHLTAIERELLPNAQLNADSHNILSNNSFKIEDENIHHDIDYFEITYEDRTLNLDTITAQRDQIVTGVRFKKNSGNIHLEVRFTYFDEMSGKLDLSTPSEWKMNSNNERNVILTSHMAVPTASIEQTIPIADTDKNAIQFGPTSWSHDMAQLTVPFVDSILIEPYELVPLSGAGLFYKSQVGYGGYLAPHLITYDYGSAALRIRAAVGVYGV